MHDAFHFPSLNSTLLYIAGPYVFLNITPLIVLNENDQSI